MSSQPMEVVLASRPKNEPDESTFRLQPIANPPTAAPANGVLLQLVVASVDPYLRGLIKRLDIGAQVPNYQVARVVESNHSSYSKGDLVLGYMPSINWQTVQQHDGSHLYRIPAELNLPATAWAGVLGKANNHTHCSSPHFLFIGVEQKHCSSSTFSDVLPQRPLTRSLLLCSMFVCTAGMPGRTAYFGLMDHEVGRMQPGKVVLVTGAAGAVGSLVGQLAKIKGAKKVIGSAGGAEKCKRVKEHYGFDECLDYKQYDTAEKMREALKKAAPDGIDILFDNTGGHVMTAAFSVFNKYARMVLCGNISSYNKNPEDNVVPNVLSAHTPHTAHPTPHTTISRARDPTTAHPLTRPSATCCCCCCVIAGV